MCLNYDVTEIIIHYEHIKKNHIHINMSLQVTLLESLGHVVHDDIVVGKVTYVMVKKLHNCIFIIGC